MQVAYNHPIGSLFPNLRGMRYCFVISESFYWTPIAVRCVDVDFNRFIWKSFTAVLFFLQDFSKAFHHVTIICDSTYIYRGRFVYTWLRGVFIACGCVRRGSRSLDVVVGEMREFCKLIG